MAGIGTEKPQMDSTLSNFEEMKVRWWSPNNARKTMVKLYSGWNTIGEFQ